MTCSVTVKTPSAVDRNRDTSGKAPGGLDASLESDGYRLLSSSIPAGPVKSLVSPGELASVISTSAGESSLFDMLCCIVVGLQKECQYEAV